MKYQIKHLEYQGKVDEMVFVFDKEFSVLSDFLGDVSSFPADYLKIFDDVLAGRTEKDSMSGNACYFEVDAEKTFIDALFPEEENHPECCTVNTRELRQLMDEWLQKRAEFLKLKEKL